MPYSPFSTRVSGYLARELKLDNEKKEILAYALENVIFTTGGFILIMAVGYILGVPKETFCAAIAGAILRKFSGGAHSKTALRCMLVGALAYPPVAFLARYFFVLLGGTSPYYAILAFCSVGSFLIVARYAPVDSKGKPIVAEDFRRKLRHGSVVTVLLFIAIAWLNMTNSIGSSIISGIVIQSISLLPFQNAGR